MKARSFEISKHAVLEARKRVKTNKGAAGVDLEMISDFEENLKDNLYKIWNRMSSGSYFPPPVKTVSIPKKAGGGRGYQAFRPYLTGSHKWLQKYTLNHSWNHIFM